MTDIERIERWLNQTGWTEGYLGKKAARNQRAVERIRAETASMATRNAILDFIKRNPAAAKATA